MIMALTVKGTIHSIGETKRMSDKFTKRDVIVECGDNPRYPQTVAFELSNDRVDLAEGLRKGDYVEIEFNLRGREWRSPQGEIKYFNTLSVWKLNRLSSAPSSGGGGKTSGRTDEPRPGDVDDIPF